MQEPSSRDIHQRMADILNHFVRLPEKDHQITGIIEVLSVAQMRAKVVGQHAISFGVGGAKNRGSGLGYTLLFQGKEHFL